MRKRKVTGTFACLIVIFVSLAGVMIYRNSNRKSTLEEDILKIEDAIGDKYKK